MLELLLKLEMSLWMSETLNNKDYLDKILHPDFKEFGMSGKIYNKNDILESPNRDINTKFPFTNLDVKQLDNTTFLLTYTSVFMENGTEVASNRSSIWVGEESFQLLFHQGTPTK